MATRLGRSSCPKVDGVTPPRGFQSIFGGVGYSPSHPSRYAGVGSRGTARLTVEGDCIVVSPLWPWRTLLRMPVLRIPLSEVQGVSRITWGIKLSVPGE